jgi:GH24 family phage-related lysozyme (muramidase)
MYKSVLDIFAPFTATFEGRIPYMYQDVLGLVTIGLGCLIDPVTMAVTLPFYRKSDNKLATVDEIRQEWNLIKNDKTLASKGHLAAKKIATLYLKQEDIDKLANKRLLLFEQELKKVFLDWDNFPANAQLAILSMTWAIGSLFYKEFPKFTKFCNNKSWWEASTECKMREEGNAGLIPRNETNKKLLECAELYPASEEIILD